MTPYEQMTSELRQLAGHAGPAGAVARAVATDGTVIEAELVSVDAHGTLVREVRADAPRLAAAGQSALKDWADALSRRISYLLETLELLETDDEQDQALIRSNPPDRQGSNTSYYEVLLSRQGPGRFVLRRYEARRGAAGRTHVDMQLTHQVMGRLARDLVETVP